MISSEKCVQSLYRIKTKLYRIQLGKKTYNEMGLNHTVFTLSRVNIFNPTNKILRQKFIPAENID
jgi:hypothetical protein